MRFRTYFITLRLLQRHVFSSSTSYGRLIGLRLEPPRPGVAGFNYQAPDHLVVPGIPLKTLLLYEQMPRNSISGDACVILPIITQLEARLPEMISTFLESQGAERTHPHEILSERKSIQAESQITEKKLLDYLWQSQLLDYFKGPSIRMDLAHVNRYLVGWCRMQLATLATT